LPENEIGMSLLVFTQETDRFRMVSLKGFSLSNSEALRFVILIFHATGPKREDTIDACIPVQLFIRF